MKRMNITSVFFVILVAVLFMGLQHTAESKATGNIVYAGQYFANTSGGQMSMILVQQGNQLTG